MSKIGQIQDLLRNELWYLTEHAYYEAQDDGLSMDDIERVLLTGKTRRSWPREEKYEVVGKAIDGRKIGIVCRITQGRKLRIITMYEDNPKDD